MPIIPNMWPPMPEITPWVAADPTTVRLFAKGPSRRTVDRRSPYTAPDKTPIAAAPAAHGFATAKCVNELMFIVRG